MKTIQRNNTYNQLAQAQKERVWLIIRRSLDTLKIII